MKISGLSKNARRNLERNESICPGCYARRLVSLLRNPACDEVDLGRLLMFGYNNGLPLMGVCRAYVALEEGVNLDLYDAFVQRLVRALQVRNPSGKMWTIHEDRPEKRRAVAVCSGCLKHENAVAACSPATPFQVFEKPENPAFLEGEETDQSAETIEN